MIKVLTSKTANYVYHMLSVGKCGYDNEYGVYARKFYNQNDISTLEKFKKHITVGGGEHCGELYGLCVSTPASFDSTDDMIEYFNAIKDLFCNGATMANFDRYLLIYQKSFSVLGVEVNKEGLDDFYTSCLPLKEPLIQILDILIANYALYDSLFWQDTFDCISKVSGELNAIFETNKYDKSWENLLNVKYKHDNFYVVLCNSIKGGPQCIDISFNKDVFSVPSDCTSFAKLVSHEFGVYLLKEILSETPAFKDFSYYKQVESLTEFYNRMVCEGYNQFDFYYTFVDKYSIIYDSNPNISPLEMFNTLISGPAE